eukprot:jgi/Tetstr1/422309/TSEL_013153.t1
MAFHHGVLPRAQCIAIEPGACRLLGGTRPRGGAGQRPGRLINPAGRRELKVGAQRGDQGLEVLSRRELGAVVAGGWAATLSPGAAGAFEVQDLGSDGAATRQQLLDCIAAGGDFEEVEAAIQLLLPFNPVPNPVEAGALQGNWRLLWSSQTAEVTKATKNLPLPFTSMQLVGPKGGEGQPGGNLPDGRAANLIKVLGGAITLKLSSSALPSETDSDAVIIGPPFRLELLLGGKSIPLQAEETTESDTSSILGNQLNTFSQLYVEGNGAGGGPACEQGHQGRPGGDQQHLRARA